MMMRRPPAPTVSAPVEPATVHVVVDSTPQGATVAAAGASVAGLPAGQPLGETPLVVDVPRGRAPIDLLLTKSGYTPLTFKLLPLQDRDVLAHLEVLPPPPPPIAVAATPPGRAAGARSRRGLPGVASARPPGGVALPALRGGAGLAPATVTSTLRPAVAGQAGRGNAQVVTPAAARPAPATSPLRR
jgi:hypothetical protein